MKKASTSINEHVRLSLDITRDEYALCSYVHYRCADPRQKIPGFCCDNKEEIAQFIGITRPGLFKMLDRMQKKDLVFVDPATRAIKSTPKWIDTENESKQSLQNDVNKVYKECKQSLQGGVNKVTVNIEVEEDLSKSKLDLKIDSAPENSTPLNTEKKDTPPIPAAPPTNTPISAAITAADWCKQNPDQLKSWIEMSRFRGGDIEPVILGFFSYYMRDAGPYHKVNTDSLSFFRNGFPGWLINQAHMKASNPTKPKQQINGGSAADKFKEKQAF